MAGSELVCVELYVTKTDARLSLLMICIAIKNLADIIEHWDGNATI